MPHKSKANAKACRAKWLAANRERFLAYQVVYNATRDKLARMAQAKIARERDPERKRVIERASKKRHLRAVRARAKVYSDAHREEIKARSKAWYWANREASRANWKRYRAANPERVLMWARQHGAKRRALARHTQVEKVDLMQILRDSKGLCGICQKPLDLFGIDFDHIVPLSKGGTHTRNNIQASHAHCNRSKGAKVG